MRAGQGYTLISQQRQLMVGMGKTFVHRQMKSIKRLQDVKQIHMC